MKRKLLTTTFLMALALAMAAPGLTDSQDICELQAVVLFATNSVQIDRGGTVTGNVVANFASPGPTLGEDAEVALDRGVTVNGDISADSIDLDKGVLVNGDLFYTDGELTAGRATINGTLNPGLELPVFVDLPHFQPADVPADAADVFVPANDLVTLGAPPDRVTDYGDLVIEEGGTVLFTGGGTFDVRSITAWETASILFDTPTILRVESRILTEKDAHVGPEGGSGIAPSDIVVHVGGINGATGDLFDVPPAVNIGQSSTVQANFYVPNGTFELDKSSHATGAFLARDIQLDRDTTIELDSAFLNLPPVADPQSVTTAGDSVLLITLTGSDPEGGDLTFEIVDPPTEGTISDPQEIVPDPIPILDREGNPTGEVIQPPITSATVIYTPIGGADLPDGFLFQALDPCGAVGVAAVDINSDETGEECPEIPVAASDVQADTTPGQPLTITLAGEGPACGANLIYTITSLPAGATLADSSGNAIESAPYTLPDSSVVFTADETGQYGFGYDASEPPASASATVSVEVDAPAGLAEDSFVETGIDTPVIVTLQAYPGGTGTPIEPPPTGSVPIAGTRAAAGSTGATIAGNVSDADGDNLGDGRDSLPGPAPILVAAGVDVNLGSTATGSVTDTAGDATESTQDDPADPDLVSASISTDGANLDLQVRFVEAGFQPNEWGSPRATFVLDTDKNPATGFPGIDAANKDSELMGVEYLVEIGGNSNNTVTVEKFVSLPNDFATVGSLTATPLADGYDVAIPLSTLGGDDGGMNFKVVTQSPITEEGFTGILDYMPDVGLDPGESAPGVRGVARIQIEWDIANLVFEEGDTAQVVLTTEKGTVDELDTMFYVGTADQDGLLEVSDYQTPAEELPDVVMPVPQGSQTGDVGTFTFDVTGELRAAVDAGFDFFTIQGRVEEDLAGGGFRRGLQVYSTADGNLPLGREPRLEISGEEPPPAVTVEVLAPLPLNGTLRTNTDPPLPVQVGTQFTSTTDLVYAPSFGFTGTDTVSYSVSQGSLIDFGTIFVSVVTLPIDPCIFNGRDPGCYDGSSAQAVGSSSLEPAQEDDGWSGPAGEIPSLRVTVAGDGTGSVASSRFATPAGDLRGLACDRRCGMDFPNGEEVALYARPIGDDSEFTRWSGDCAGTEIITTIRIWGRHLCVAEFGKKNE